MLSYKKIILTRTKGTESMWRNVASILSFKQFAYLKGRNGMQKKIMQNKRMEVKPALNIKMLTTNVNEIKKIVLRTITFNLNLLSDNEIIFM